MKEFIINNLAAGSYISFGEVFFKLLMALIIGGTVYVTYYFSSPKVTYSSSFNFSLVAMTVITTAITSVIASNIALSLGMVGALSIIRFRTAIKDPRDAMFIFWSIMVGICCGAAQYIIAMATTVILCLFYLFAKVSKEEKRYILIVRCPLSSLEEVKAITFRHFPTSRVSVENTTGTYAELIYELKHFHGTGTEPYLNELYTCPGIECANFVLEEDKGNA